jgi:hypothetical protein
MALKLFDGTLAVAFDTTARKLHYVTVVDGAVTADLGAVVSDIGAITLDAPAVNVGNVGLVDSAENEIDPATSGKQDTLINATDYVVVAEYTATIGATSIIPTAFTATLPAGLVRIILIPRGDVYYKIGGAASASTAKVPAGGLNLPMTKTVADTVQVFASSVGCDLLVCVKRA